MTNWILGLGAVVIAGLERHPRLRFAPQRFFRSHFESDAVYVLTSYVAGGVAGFAYLAAASAWLGQLGVPRLGSLALSLWITVPIAIVALDLFNYLTHVLLHRVDVLWETHKAHHSTLELDWLAAFRQHFLEAAFRRALTPVPFILVGFPMEAMLIGFAITISLFGMLTHSNLRLDLGALEPVFITPRLHRLHHTTTTTERNLGSVLTVWDRLFGTLATEESGSDARLGVPGEVDTYPQGWHRQLLEPFRRIGAASRRGAAEEARAL